MAKSELTDRLGIRVDREIFKGKVRLLRKEMGLNDVQLAEKLGITGGAVRMWESGLSVPTDRRLEALLRLARDNGIDITPGFLLAGEGTGPEWTQGNVRPHRPRTAVRPSVAGTIPVKAALDNGDGSITISGEIERAVAPRNLVGREGAYGLFVPNDDMAPALRYGDIAWVDTMLPPARDSEVVVEGPEGAAAIGTLVAYGKDKLTIEVLQPERRRIELSRSEARVHRIVGKEARR
jgi:DNA-binding transcriptional regulator YiaG